MIPRASESCYAPAMVPVRGRRLESKSDIDALLRQIRTIAVIGIKTAAQADQPAYYVPAFAAERGYRIFPVPVYYPDVTEILGQAVHRSLATIQEPVELVNLFRRPADVPGHLDDILAKHPRAVWMQSGIRNEAVAERLLEAGIDVVQDRCLLVELSR
jgi:predicted CoA-binding protein